MNDEMSRGSAAPPGGPSYDTVHVLGAAVRALILVTAFAMISLRGRLAWAPALWQAIAWAGAAYLVLSAIFAWQSPRRWERYSLAFTSLDIFWVTWVVWLTREVGSAYVLYYVPVLHAAMRLEARDAGSAALLSAVCYFFVVALLGQARTLSGLMLPLIFSVSAVAIAAVFAAMAGQAKHAVTGAGSARPAEGLYAIRSAAASSEPETVAQALADAVHRAMEAEAVRLSVLGARTGELQAAAVVGSQSEWLREAAGLAEHVAFQGEPVAAQGRLTKELAAKGLALPGKARSYVGVPLRSRGRLVGVLEGAWKASRPLENDLDMLLILGAEVAQQLASRLDIGFTSAGRDAVTGLWSHSEFQERLSQEIDRARRSEQALSILLADIDGFSSFNEGHGYRLGDALLGAVGVRVQSQAREADFLARYGPDEFGIILPDTDRTGAMLAGERFRAVVAQAPFALPGGVGEAVTVSVGVACYPADGRDPGELVAAAAEPLRSEGADRVVSAGEGY